MRREGRQFLHITNLRDSRVILFYTVIFLYLVVGLPLLADVYRRSSQCVEYNKCVSWRSEMALCVGWFFVLLPFSQIAIRLTTRLRRPLMENRNRLLWLAYRKMYSPTFNWLLYAESRLL